MSAHVDVLASQLADDAKARRALLDAPAGWCAEHGLGADERDELVRALRSRAEHLATPAQRTVLAVCFALVSCAPRELIHHARARPPGRPGR